MPEQTHCPKCLQKLRVPATMLGKKVKCPKCATIFEAMAEHKEEEAGYGVKEDAEPRPKKKIARMYEDEEDDDAEFEDEREKEYDDEPRRRKKKRGSKSRALDKIRIPAIGLQVGAILSLLITCLWTPFYIFYFLPQSAQIIQHVGPKGPAVAGVQGAILTYQVIAGCWGLIIAAIQLGLFHGARRMQQLESYTESLVVGIISVIPCCTLMLTGVPFGIWALLVMNSDDVRPYFR